MLKRECEKRVLSTNHSQGQNERHLDQLSSTGVHGAPWGEPNYAWGAPLRKDSQGCITNLSHETDSLLFTKTFC